MRDSLAKYQPISPMSDDELLKKKSQAWQDRIALVVTFEQLAKLPNREFEVCMNIGNKLYGVRKL